MPSSRYFLGTVPWYSVLILLGMCLAIAWCMREEKRLGLPADTTVDLALLVIPFGIIGARLYYVFFAWEAFAADPISILQIWRGGLAIYGGIIGGLLAIVVYARRRKLPLLKLCDMVVPGLALAQAIGRWGNFFNMEAYGLPVTDPRLQFFPLAVLIPENGELVWHMATFFYESMWNLTVFAVLALTRKRMRRFGDVTLWYMLLYGMGRLVIEGLRMDSLMTTGGALRVSQLLSVLLCLGVICVFGLRVVKASRKKLSAVLLAALLAVCIVWAGWIVFGAQPLICLGFDVLCLISAVGLYRRTNRLI